MSDVNKTAMDFPDLEPVKVPVTIGRKMDREGKPIPSHFLFEASEDAATKYQNTSMKAARFNEEGNVSGVDGAAEVEPLLVSLCLFESDINGQPQFDKDGKPMGAVALSYIKGLPARIVKPLFDRAVEISGLETKMTLTTIDKQIARLYKLRDKVSKEQGINTPPKEQPAATPTTSD